MIVTGQVTRDSGEDWGIGAARVRITEVLRGLPPSWVGREMEVDTGAGSSCYMRLVAGRTYAIFGGRKGESELQRSWCSGSFDVAGNSKLLNALKSVLRNERPRLVGSLFVMDPDKGGRVEAPPEITVVAENSSGRQWKTLTADRGEFEFRNMEPGNYNLRAFSEHFDPVAISYLPPNAVLPKTGCAHNLLFMRSKASVSGVLRDQGGRPLAGVPVQLFATRNTFDGEANPLLQDTTDDLGRFHLKGAPPGEVLIGVNAAPDIDANPWLPTFYPGTRTREAAKTVKLLPSQQLTGIDFAIPPPRETAELFVEVHLTDGTMVPDPTIKLRDKNGAQRLRAGQYLGRNSNGSLSVYKGEAYIVEATYSLDGRNWKGISKLIKIEGAQTRTVLELKTVWP